MRDIGQQGTQCHHELDPDRLGHVDYQLAETAPPERWLGATEQDQVAGCARDPRLVELDLWPDDLPGLTLDQLDARPRGLEVVELLGIDGREAPRAERRADGCDRRRGGVRGVVPALERADQGRSAQTVGPVLPSQR